MAVQARVPIVPIVVANYNTFYDSKTKRFNAGTIKIKGKCSLYMLLLAARLLNVNVLCFSPSTRTHGRY